MSIKPIEAGCTAIATYASNKKYQYVVGNVVTVIKFLGQPSSYLLSLRGYSDVWLIEYEGHEAETREPWLLRIDGGKFEEEQAEELVLVNE